jgi:hypothetical protein
MKKLNNQIWKESKWKHGKNHGNERTWYNFVNEKSQVDELGRLSDILDTKILTPLVGTKLIWPNNLLWPTPPYLLEDIQKVS